MIKESIIFISGAAVGFGAAMLILRDRYKQMVDEEVSSVMEWAKKKSVKTNSDHVEEMKEVEKISKNYKTDETEEVHDWIAPYCISAKEYESDSEIQAKKSLDYYLQGEGLYDGEIPIDDIEKHVGEDNLVRLHGDLDVVYVRNENLGIDYEIVGVQGRFGAY